MNATVCMATAMALSVATASAEEPASLASPISAPGVAAAPGGGLTWFPTGPAAGEDRWAIGGIWQIAPMFTASYRRGLGDGFTVDARLQTVILYNDIGVGGQWAAKAGPFSLGVMAHFDGYLGTLGKAFVQTTQFDAIGWGVLFDPGVKAGLQVTRDSWLTLQFEAYLSLYQAAKLGDLTVSPNSALWEGFGTSLVVEYRPGQRSVIYYGVSLYHTRTNYPLWFNVEASGSGESVNARKIWYLGLLGGYEF